MMVNNRVSKCSILISYKLEPTRSTLTSSISIGCTKHEVSTRSRGTFLVNDFDRMRRSLASSVAWLVEVILGVWHGQVVIGHGHHLFGKGGGALVFILEDLIFSMISTRYVFDTPQARIEVVEVVARDCARTRCQVNLNFLSSGTGAETTTCKPSICNPISLSIRSHSWQEAPSAFPLPSRLTQLRYSHRVLIWTIKVVYCHMQLFITSSFEFTRSVARQVRYLRRPHQVLLRQHIITSTPEESASLEYLLRWCLLVRAGLALRVVAVVVKMQLGIFFGAILLVRLLLARENLFMRHIHTVIIVVVAKRWRSL